MRDAGQANKRYSILVVGSGNCLLRTALSALLESECTVEKLDQVDNLTEARVLLSRENFTVTIFFVAHPMSESLAQLERLSATTRLVLVLEKGEKFAMQYFSKYKVDGLISTESTYAEFKTAIHAIGYRKQKYVSPALISAISNLFGDGTSPTFSELSKKEMDVAIHLLDGKRNTDIASELHISEKTVSTYKARIFRKLHINSDAQLFQYAYNSGLARDSRSRADRNDIRKH